MNNRFVLLVFALLFFLAQPVGGARADTPTPTIAPSATPNYRATTAPCINPTNPIGTTATPVPFMRPAPCDHVRTVPTFWTDDMWMFFAGLSVAIIYGLVRFFLGMLPSS